MRSVYIFAAMRSEARPVEKMLAREAGASSDAQLREGQIGNNKVVLFVTGMGPRRARKSAEDALDWVSRPAPQLTIRPDAVLVIGTCGSLCPSLPENLIVTYGTCLSADFSLMPQTCSAELNRCFASLLRSKGLSFESAVGITSPRVATHLEERLALAKSGATVIDMESYEIVAAAKRARIPAAVLRVVSDALDRKMPDFDSALKPDGDFDGLKALRVAVGSPVQTAKMIAASRRAIGHLTGALQIILPSDCFLPKLA